MHTSKWMAFATALIATLTLSTRPADAAPGGKGPKHTSAKPPTTRGPAAKPVKAPKRTTTATTASTRGTSARANSPKKSRPTTTTTSTSTANTSTTSTTSRWAPDNAVAKKLVDKPNQLNKALAVLPDGTDLNKATAGFKNFGQFNAAVNAAQNHGISFADLKAAMTGTTLDGKPTNEPTLSLGQAIKKVKGLSSTDAVDQ